MLARSLPAPLESAAGRCAAGGSADELLRRAPRPGAARGRPRPSCRRPPAVEVTDDERFCGGRRSPALGERAAPCAPPTGAAADRGSVRAFVVEHAATRSTPRCATSTRRRSSTTGDVTVAVEWSCCNFKDAMVASPRAASRRRDGAHRGRRRRRGRCVASDERLDAALGTPRHRPGPRLRDLAPRRFRPAARAARGVAHAAPRRPRAAHGDGPRHRGVHGDGAVLALEATRAHERRGPGPRHGRDRRRRLTAVALLAARGFEVVAMTGKASTSRLPHGARGARRHRPRRDRGPTRSRARRRAVRRRRRLRRWRDALATSCAAALGRGGRGDRARRRGDALGRPSTPSSRATWRSSGIDSVDAPATVRAEVWATLAGALARRGARRPGRPRGRARRDRRRASASSTAGRPRTVRRRPDALGLRLAAVERARRAPCPGRTRASWRP